MAGVCLIRLKQIRPDGLPSCLGVSSENAAHRIAVEWDVDGATQEGVFISRRDTSSRLNAVVGGRLFPGVHHHAVFRVQEHDDRYRIELSSDDHRMRLLVEGRAAAQFPPGSVFGSLREASDFFERGSLGYSLTSTPGQFEGLELRSVDWRVRSFAIDKLESSFFESRSLFPAGAVEFDSSLLMQGINHEWRARKKLCCPEDVDRRLVRPCGAGRPDPMNLRCD